MDDGLSPTRPTGDRMVGCRRMCSAAPCHGGIYLLVAVLAFGIAGMSAQARAAKTPPEHLSGPPNHDHVYQDVIAAYKAKLGSLTPVTKAMLANPPAGDWLTWRRGDSSHGFSPLTQINTKSIKRLVPAWNWWNPGWYGSRNGGQPLRSRPRTGRPSGARWPANAEPLRRPGLLRPGYAPAT